MKSTPSVIGRTEEIIDLYLNNKSIKEICKHLNSSSTCYIWEILKKNGITIRANGEERRKYKLNIDFFDEIDTEEKAYILGFLYADGYNNEKKGEISLCLKESDKDILLKITKILQPEKPLSYKVYKQKAGGFENRENQYSISISNKHMSNQLAKLGCPQAKTFLLTFPTVEQVPEYLQRHFIRGYFEGDGCISGKKYPAIDIVGTSEFLASLQEVLINNLKFSKTKLAIRHKDRINNIVALRYGGINQIKNFRHYLYHDSTIYLDRKHNKIFSY